jgi:uncharacterized protein
MREPYRSLLPLLHAEVRRLLASHPQCHGWDHTVRVWHTARRLASLEHADRAVAEYAALLHDIGRAEEDCTNGETCHAAAGAEQVPDVLRRIGVTDNAFIGRVAACVATHRYRRRDARPPLSLEAKIVFDADKLDSLGAVGIGRAFHFAGRIGARVHNTEDEALNAPGYSREDSAYREYLVKLRHLPAVMLTAEGRRIARERHAFMAAFFERLNQEVEATAAGGSEETGKQGSEPS